MFHREQVHATPTGIRRLTNYQLTVILSAILPTKSNVAGSLCYNEHPKILALPALGDEGHEDIQKEASIFFTPE